LVGGKIKRAFDKKILPSKRGVWFLTQNSAVTKQFVFFLRLKQSFQCLTRCLYGSPKYGCIIKAVRGTWNFVWQQATLAQGCASEAHLNMDVNLRRLPDKPKF